LNHDGEINWKGATRGQRGIDALLIGVSFAVEALAGREGSTRVRAPNDVDGGRI
jgi:hypothetical protein